MSALQSVSKTAGSLAARLIGQHIAAPRGSSAGFLSKAAARKDRRVKMETGLRTSFQLSFTQLKWIRGQRKIVENPIIGKLDTQHRLINNSV